jgi:hypothetical protein
LKRTPQQPRRPNTRLLFIGLIVLIVALAAFTVFQLTRPSGLPTSWLATQTVGSRQIVYYLHWGDDNGILRGKMETVVPANGKLQTSSWSFIATYNDQNNMLHMTFEVSKSATIPMYSADASITNDTLKILKTNNTNAASDSPAYHPASEQDYEQARQNLAQPS